MPKDPMAECRVNWKTVKAFHAFVELEPVLLPKLIAVVFAKVLVAAIMAILGCLGFVWGKQLYDRLNSGYAHVAAPQRHNLPAQAPGFFPQQPSHQPFPLTMMRGPGAAGFQQMPGGTAVAPAPAPLLPVTAQSSWPQYAIPWGQQATQGAQYAPAGSPGAPNGGQAMAMYPSMPPSRPVPAPMPPPGQQFADGLPPASSAVHHGAPGVATWAQE